MTHPDLSDPKQRRWAQEIARQQSAVLRAYARWNVTPPSCAPTDPLDDFHPNRNVESVRLCAATPARLTEPRKDHRASKNERSMTHVKSDDERVPARCWCDSTTVMVLPPDIRAGRTASCGPTCTPESIAS